MPGRDAYLDGLLAFEFHGLPDAPGSGASARRQICEMFMRRQRQRTKRRNGRSERMRRITAVAAVIAVLAAGFFAATETKIELSSPSCLCRMTVKSAAGFCSTTGPDG
jgi:hypothetical protein